MAEFATIECFKGVTKGIARCGSVGIAEVAIVKVAEAIKHAGALLTAEDMSDIRAITSPARRQQRMAWRVAAREVLGRSVRFTYNTVGAPEIDNSPQKISVSHSDSLAVVAISNGPCGVDIERLDRNFDRVESRYISPAEKALPTSSHPHFRATIWCAKEAIYKFLGMQEVDFIKDISILSVDMGRGVLIGSFRGRELPPIEMRITDRHMLCILSDSHSESLSK